MTPEPNIAEAMRFLQLLDPQATAFSFQVVDDVRLKNGKPRDDKKLSQTLHGTLAQHAPHLARINSKFGAAVYLAINKTDLKGRLAANIIGKRAAWVDLDRGLPQRWELHPSVIVETSPGKFQAYWLVAGSVSDSDFLGVLRHMALTYGGDLGVVSVERVLRLPGFWHQKGTPFLVRIVEASGHRYGIDEIVTVHPPVAQEKKAAEKLPEIIHEDTRNRTLASAAGTMRRRGFPVEAIEAALHVLNQQQCSPPIAGKEVEKIARSSGSYPPGPLVKEGDIKWPEITKDDVPFPRSAANIAAYLQHLGAIVWTNEFDGRAYIDGFESFADLSDEAMRRLNILAESYSFRVPKEAFRDYVLDLAGQDARHPVREYLMGLRWDGTPRVQQWLATYLAAADDPAYLADVGRLVLMAAVQRVRSPGCKFDYLVVLQGPQDIGKSTVWRILAGDSWFTDSLLVGADPKVIIEQTLGKWIVEHAELDGMGHRDAERIKAMISRQEDTARLAYGHTATTVRRQFVLVGTTNNADFLRDETGNRRFLPIKCGRIDLAGLRRDRDQLWAETVHMANQAIQARTMRLDLPQETRPLAIAAQAARQIISPIEDRLGALLSQIRHGFIPTRDLFDALDLRRIDERNRSVVQIGRVMAKLGWAKHKRRDQGTPRWGYWIGAADALLYIWNPSTGAFAADPEHPGNRYMQ